MKIVYVITRADEIGGAQVHVRDLATAMHEAGHEVCVIAGSVGRLNLQLTERGVSFRSVPALIRSLHPRRDVTAWLQLKALLAKLQPDLVSTHSSKAGWLGRLAARALGIPVLFTAHGWAFTEGVPELQRRLYVFAERAAARFTLQNGKADLGHQHLLSEIADVGALAGKDVVAAGDVADAAVGATALAAAAVGEGHLGDAAVSSAKLADGAVTTSKIAPGAVTVAKLAPGTADRLLGYDQQGNPAEIAQGADGGIDADTLDGQQASAFATAEHGHTLADVSDAGALAGKDTVGANDLAANAVSTSKIASSAVTGVKLADGAVTTSKIAASAITQDKIASDAIGADQLQDGIPINMQDQLLTRPQLKDFSETSATPSINADSLTLDLETGNVFEVALIQNVTSLTFANPPATGRVGSVTLILVQDATGGRTLAWPETMRWAGRTPIAISSAANAVDVFAFFTKDGGATWYGFLGGKDFS